MRQKTCYRRVALQGLPVCLSIRWRITVSESKTAIIQNSIYQIKSNKGSLNISVFVLASLMWFWVDIHISGFPFMALRCQYFTKLLLYYKI